MKLRDLHILLTVAQAGSMVRASHQLSMSQPAVSKAIATLEHAIGVPLLERGALGVTPTRYGEALLRRGTAAFDELRRGIGEIEFLSNPAVGELRLGYGEPVATTLIPTVVAALSSNYPDIVFHLRQANTIALDFRDLRERKVDLMVGRIPVPFKEDDLHAETILQHSAVVVAGTQSPWARRRKLQLAELVNEKWVLLPPEMPESEYVASAFRAQGLTPPQATVTSLSFQMRAALLARGDFLSAFPPDLVNRYSSLKALPVELGLQPRPIAIVMLKNRIPGPVAELFVSHLRSAARATLESKTIVGRTLGIA